MFPYRRPGQKKRPKNIANRGGKPKGPPPKGMPASARELLPMLQPATKALAQMLAGRAQQSGQYGHARAVLARAERLVAERATDRLNPAEREEFFEQLARLKLTIADAELEAEAVAEEAAEPSKPAPPPVGRERLREMAMALAGPAPPEAEPAGGDDDPDDRPAAAVATVAADESPARAPLRLPVAPPAAPAQPTAREPVVLKPIAPPPPAASAADTGEAGSTSAPPQPPRRRGGARRPAAVPAPDSAVRQDGNGQTSRAGRGGPPARQTTSRDKTLHLPDGWVIDEEGYVVPRSG